MAVGPAVWSPRQLDQGRRGDIFPAWILGAVGTMDCRLTWCMIDAGWELLEGSAVLGAIVYDLSTMQYRDSHGTPLGPRWDSARDRFLAEIAAKKAGRVKNPKLR